MVIGFPTIIITCLPLRTWSNLKCDKYLNEFSTKVNCSCAANHSMVIDNVKYNWRITTCTAVGASGYWDPPFTAECERKDYTYKTLG